MSDTSSGIQATTQPEACDGREIEVITRPGFEVFTGAQYSASSMPSGLPEVSVEGSGYVFRLGEGPPLHQVVISLDIRQLTEQARIKKMNQAIRRANRR
jgi:hypothetical protein